MAENIKELIEKIQSEGVNVAEEKARKIEEDAETKKGEILKKAKLEAENLLAEAKDKISKMEEASRTSLEQYSRDLFLSIKKEIQASLGKIILSQVHQALTVDELAKIIDSIAKTKSTSTSEEIIFTLSNDDIKKLENTFLKGLKEDILKGIKLKAKDDIAAGFLISYDAGKSHFDFTDKALAEYLGSYVKPKLAEILKSAVI